MVEPNIIKTKYYTLVSADTGHGKTLWCKKKVARLLRTTQDRIIVIDVTGEYADFVLDHDRIVPGRIPMVMHQYKLSGGWPVDAHIIEVDMPMNRQPQLIVYDIRDHQALWYRPAQLQAGWTCGDDEELLPPVLVRQRTPKARGGRTGLSSPFRPKSNVIGSRAKQKRNGRCRIPQWKR